MLYALVRTRGVGQIHEGSPSRPQLTYASGSEKTKWRDPNPYAFSWKRPFKRYDDARQFLQILKGLSLRQQFQLAYKRFVGSEIPSTATYTPSEMKLYLGDWLWNAERQAKTSRKENYRDFELESECNAVRRVLFADMLELEETQSHLAAAKRTTRTPLQRSEIEDWRKRVAFWQQNVDIAKNDALKACTFPGSSKKAFRRLITRRRTKCGPFTLYS